MSLRLVQVAEGLNLSLYQKLRRCVCTDNHWLIRLSLRPCRVLAVLSCLVHISVRFCLALGWNSLLGALSTRLAREPGVDERFFLGSGTCVRPHLLTLLCFVVRHAHHDFFGLGSLQLLLLLFLLCLFQHLLLFEAAQMFLCFASLDGHDDAKSAACREGVVAHEASDRFSHVVDLGHLDQHGDVVVEGTVIWVVVPRYDRQTTLGLQHVRSGAVVDNYGVLHVAPQLRHVLNEDAVDEGAVLTEETRSAKALRIHHVHQRISILQAANTNRVMEAS